MATQIAVYLGFGEIYYLGADNSYSIEMNLDGLIKCDTAIKDYPSEIGQIELETSNIPQTGLVAMAYESVKKYADTHGIRVYNATRGEKLEVFQRVDFDSLLKNEIDKKIKNLKKGVKYFKNPPIYNTSKTNYFKT